MATYKRFFSWTEAMRTEHHGTANLERRRESLLKKAKEYRKQLELLMVCLFYECILSSGLTGAFGCEAEMPEDSPVTVTDITTQQEINRRKEQELKGKRAKIKAFQGLPPVSFHPSFPGLVGLKLKPPQNLELARHELQNAQSELTKLLHLRERLLGRMADGVA